MKTTRSLIALLILGSSLSAFAQWSEVKSQNFTILTNGSAGQAREVAVRFEQMRALFGALFKRTKVTIPVPLTVFAFRNAHDLKENGPLFNGKPVEVAGYYQMGEDRNFIALDLSTEYSYEVVFHEYAHMLLNANYPRTQPWFDEGFAEFYSSMTIGKTQAEIGRAPQSAQVVFSEMQSLMPIVTLFSVGHDSKTYNETSNKRTMFYAQSWLLMHWIFDNQKLPDTARYFDAVMNRKMSIPEAIQYGFGMTPKKLDEVLYTYLRNGRGNVFKANLPINIDPSLIVVKKLSDSASRSALADLHLHMIDRQAQGVSEFEQIIKAEPDNEVAHRDLAFAYLWKHDLDKARPHLQRAVELNSQDARVHYYNAVLMNRGSQQVAENDTASLQMIAELQRATDLDPNYADAWHLLAISQMNTQKPEQALASMKHAVALSPRNDFYRLTLAQIMISTNQVGDAKALLTVLQSSTDPQVAEHATQLMANADVVAEQKKRWAEQGISSYKDVTDPRWKPKEGAKSSDEDAPEKSAAPDTRKIEYVKGTLLSVNCADPAATVTVTAAGRKWQFKTPDYKKLVLIGADDFNCTWKNVKASINYKSNGPGQGDLVSLEVN
jgi:Tfp pilus assembly protein PilF